MVSDESYVVGALLCEELMVFSDKAGRRVDMLGIARVLGKWSTGCEMGDVGKGRGRAGFFLVQSR